jgi:hypothetical protein
MAFLAYKYYLILSNYHCRKPTAFYIQAQRGLGGKRGFMHTILIKTFILRFEILNLLALY